MVRKPRKRSRPRKPRDLANYVPAKEVAASLRKRADELEENAVAGEIIKVNVSFWYWWEETDD